MANRAFSIGGDHKSQLGEWAQAKGYTVAYAIVHVEGPTNNCEFTAKCTVGRLTEYGKGTSKKNAEKVAAAEVLHTLTLTNGVPENMVIGREYLYKPLQLVGASILSLMKK